MRKYTTLLTLSVVAALALFSCTKSSSPVSYRMSATVTKDGSVTSFLATGDTFVAALDTNGRCEMIGDEMGSTASIAAFIFTIYNFTGTGTYTLDSINSADYATASNGYWAVSFINGTISINSISGENISGTFSGTLIDSTVITNGKFTAKGKGF